MYKFLKVTVPVIQVLVAVIGYNLARLFPGSRWIHPDASFIKDLVGKLNFPLEISLTLIDRMGGSLPTPKEPLFTFVVVIFAILLLAIGAAFWYFVVAEIEMRSKGKSLLRSSNSFKQVFISVILLILGLSAIFIASRDGFFSAVPIRTTNYYILLRGLILLAWAIVLIGVAVRDLWIVADRRTRTKVPPGPADPLQ